MSMSPLTLAFPGLTMSVVVVSSPPCEKVDADTGWFKATFDDLRTHEPRGMIDPHPNHNEDSSRDLRVEDYWIRKGRHRRSFGVAI